MNQMVRVCDHLALSEAAADEALRRARQRASTMDHLACTAPEYSAELYRVLAEASGCDDPYAGLKRKHNALVRESEEFFRTAIAAAADPLRTAGRFALLGNIIDLGGERLFDHDEIFRHADDHPPHVDEYEALNRMFPAAGIVLYIADNAGEAVLDRLFIAEMRRRHAGLKVYYAVRSRPAINDVTAADAVDAGVGEVAEILESGSTCAGTVVERCSEPFRRLFREAPLVIAKGQGNFETLEGESRPIHFIFQVKCRVVADHLGLPLRTRIFATRAGIAASGGRS